MGSILQVLMQCPLRRMMHGEHLELMLGPKLLHQGSTSGNVADLPAGHMKVLAKGENSQTLLAQCRA